ncbi:M20/M25/M40 family metallo-hydrolase [Rhizobium oryzicola]|uniref:M20/M25/M40 family metallo-hydrolase n=1 Tax=Rhizobium oryzicola TaxID=1232668 RepID=A0ABT8SVU2_9HYPH|nr:M20/M25/M40 family metallo-hydrolase [Rhizobium oryzicola]MDO1582569.1 M20/M25/M40 family metallo-hydrolase [Rhizobium oryzicola]
MSLVYEPSAAFSVAETEAVSFVSDLIRIRSVNTGDPDTIGDGEAIAAAYIRDRLNEVGLASDYVEPVSGRGNVICRIKGSNPNAPALILHAHLDVVPADDAEWSVPPFSGEIRDGMLYGRGAVDMKNMAGMMLAVARDLARERFVPERDIVFMWFSDEENGSVYGSQWLTEKEAHFFEGASEAISEVGGFSITLPNGKRAYPLATAEKGVARVKLTARGTAGHGALVNGDNAVTRLAEAVHRIGTHTFPIHRTPHLDAMLRGLEELLDTKFDDDKLDQQLGQFGFFASTIRASLRNTANPTMMNAGYKRNVIPSTAEAIIDGRVLPGLQDEFVREVEALVGPGIDIEWTFGWTIESRVDGPLMEKMSAAIRAEDPDGTVIPYLLPGGTDNKLLSKIGISGYGFVPMRVPADFDVWGLFHAVDERVPIAGLAFGVRVFLRLLKAC